MIRPLFPALRASRDRARFLLRKLVPGDGDKSPVFARGGAGAPAALCLHGFTGTPFEVRPIAEALAARGFTVAAPLLAGHGDSLGALAATRWQDWFASAERALAELRVAAGGTPVAVAGFSLGGLLALRLALAQPDAVAALAVIAAPLRLRPLHVAAVRLLARLPRALRRGPIAAIPKTRGYDVVDERMQGRNPGLPALPLEGVLSLIELGDLVRRDLHAVTAPTLVAHGLHDRTVPFEDSLELAAMLRAPVERLWLARSGHLVPIDLDGPILCQAIARFFAERLGARAPEAGASIATKEAAS